MHAILGQNERCLSTYECGENIHLQWQYVFALVEKFMETNLTTIKTKNVKFE